MWPSVVRRLGKVGLLLREDLEAEAPAVRSCVRWMVGQIDNNHPLIAASGCLSAGGVGTTNCLCSCCEKAWWRESEVERSSCRWLLISVAWTVVFLL